MIGTISIRTVEALAPGTTLWDATLSGFGVRRQTTAAVYIVKYRSAGKQRFFTIGKHGPLTPDKARREAKRLLGEVATGSDPATQKAEAKSAAADTLSSVIDAYLADAASRLRPRSFIETQRHLRIAWAPLHNVSVFSLSRRDVAEHIRTITASQGANPASGARAALSACLAWAIREGYELPANPVAGTNRPPPTKSRERVLTDTELRSIWLACDDDEYGRIVRLLMLTAQRRNEVGGLRWDEITFTTTAEGVAAQWTLPAERAKNHIAHTVPLLPRTVALLPPRRKGSPFVFGTGRNGFGGWVRGKTRLDQQIRIAPYTLHDLRRTAATVMADRLGVLPHVVEAILNHVSGSPVSRVYNKARYLSEMTEALAAWADHIAALVEETANG
jgi:integrase